MGFRLRNICSDQADTSKGFLYLGIIQTVIGMVFLDDAVIIFADSEMPLSGSCCFNVREHCIIGNLRYAVI